MFEKNIAELKEKYKSIEIESKSNGIVIKYMEEVIEEEIKEEEDFIQIDQLLDSINAIYELYPEFKMKIIDSTYFVIEDELWDGNEFNVSLDYLNKEMILKIIEMTKYIKNKDKDINIFVSLDFNLITLTKQDWRRELRFGGEISEYDLEEVEVTFDMIKKFFEYEYKNRSCCYTEDCIEYPITIAHSIQTFFGTFGLNDTAPERLIDTAINFEISTISEHFWNHCLMDQRADGEEIYEDTAISTLKIYNLNKFLGIDKNANNFLQKSYEVALNILFKLSHKYNIDLNIVDFPDYDDDSFIYDFEDELDNIENIDEHTLFKLYDNDLVNYYYRAINMEDSEFKYLAFYQILECIFDEVHLHATVQDVKHIINSDWFSKHNDDDIKEVIKVVETYNKKRNDREKLILVLESYFRGSAHDKAYLIANRTIINHLKEMDFLKKEEELKDIQKLVNIIYDYRCKCTHSNRTYPFRSVFEDSNDELSKYITLIRKIAEKVIINYEKK